MKFTSFTTLFSTAFFVASTLVTASPLAVNLANRDVFVPPILYPHNGTVWIVGQNHSVVWNTSDAPAQITNSIGSIMLRKSGLTTSTILASNFSILDGRVNITVPSVADGDDYQLVLFGDSGNFSPNFTITNNRNQCK